MTPRQAFHALYSRAPLTEIAVAAIFLASAIGAILMTRVNGGIALLWPATAIAAALLIRLPLVRWMSVGVLLFGACLAANVFIAHRDWPISIKLSCVNVVEIAMMAGVFRSLARFPYPNISIGQAAIVVAGFGIAIPGLVALAAGAAFYESDGTPLLASALQWWGSHAIGACLLGPPIILFSVKSLRRLASTKFLAQNMAALVMVLLGCWIAILYVRFPFIVIGVLLMIAAFRVGGFGASVLGLCSGLEIAVLWALGVRPVGLENNSSGLSLVGLPIIALLATTLPPIAVGLGADAQRAAVRRLNLSEHRYRESMEHSPLGMLIADLSGVWGYTNIALQTMLGFSAAEFRALPPGGPSEPEEWITSATRWQRLLSGEITNYDIERRFRHKDGHWVWTHVAVSLVRNEEGKPLHLVAQIESLEARRRAEENLAEERERLRITLVSIDEAVITTDAQTRITYLNSSAENMLGLNMDAVRGRPVNEVIYLMDPQTSKAAANLIAQCAIHGEVIRRPHACILHRSDGSFTFVADVVSPVLSNGAVTGMVMVLRDVSGDVSEAQELKHRASHDPMTGLANRFEFQRQLTDLFKRANYLDEPAALLAIDLDRFKAVNDTGGHAAGDSVLRAVAEVLRITVRQSDIVARLGGDEFAVLLPKCPEARSMVLAQKILTALNPLQAEWNGATYSTGASIGVTMLNPQFDAAADWLAAADGACYLAKKGGRGQLWTEKGAESVPVRTAMLVKNAK